MDVSKNNIEHISLWTNQRSCKKRTRRCVSDERVINRFEIHFSPRLDDMVKETSGLFITNTVLFVMNKKKDFSVLLFYVNHRDFKNIL